MNLIDILSDSHKRYAHLPAVSMQIGYRTLTLTYAQVYEKAQDVAHLLAAHGVKPGDHILLCAPNSPLWVCVFWGSLLRGAVLVPLALQSTQAMFDKIADQTRSVLFFKSASVRLEFEQGSTVQLEQVFFDMPRSSDVYEYDACESDPVEIIYTSGTTGDPKGVILTHGNLVSNLTAVKEAIKLDGLRECILSILPLSHMLEQMGGFLLPFSVGAHIVYAHSHGALRSLLQRYRITTIMAVPEFLELMKSRIMATAEEKKWSRLLKMMLFLSSGIRYKPLQRLLLLPITRSLGGRLTTIASGGAQLEHELEAFWDACGITVLQGYGLTETSPVISINTYAQRRLGSVGKPVSSVAVRLASDGEIEVRGASVFSGYFNNPDKTRESFTADGWFATGDIGCFDSDGFLYLKGRKKYMIKGPGAQNIFPEDIEEALNKQQGVKDSCVIGVQRHAGLIEIHAALLLEPNVDAENIIDQVNAELVSFQHVTGWTVWPEDDFPRTVTGKIKKEEVSKAVMVPQAAPAHRPSQSTSVIIRILAEITGLSRDDIHEKTLLVRDLKIDSLMRVELVTRLEEACGVTIDERCITATTRVEDVMATLSSTQPMEKIPAVKAWPRSLWARGIRRIGQWLISGLAKLFFKLEVHGLEHLRNITQPVVIMPNHVSMIDGLIIMACLPKNLKHTISFAAAYDILYQQFWWARPLAELFFNAFPLPRNENEHIATGLMNMGAMLDQGYSVVVFPEGHISKDGVLLPLKRGAGLIAVEMRCVVVPVILGGVEKLVPYEGFLPRKRGTVSIIFGPSLRFERSVPYDSATDQISRALAALQKPMH